jgi:4-amino-4-deoxy-L-arabinose transferase-like glycosyltransferase
VLWLVAVIVLGALLRFCSLGLQSFDIDESVTVALLHQGLAGTLHSIPITEKTPPLYYVLAWLWSQGFGLSEVGVRSFSALVGTLTVPLAYDAGRQLVSKRTGLIAAGLVATSPFLIWYGQEARAYALLGLLAAGSFVLFVRVMKRPTNRLIAAWAFVSALALATHYFAVFLVIPEALWLLMRVKPMSRILLAIGGIGVVGVGLLPLALHQAREFHGREGFLGMPLHSRIALVPIQFLLGPEASGGSKALLLSVGLVAVMVGLLLLAYQGKRQAQAAAGVVLVVGLVALLVPVGLALVGTDYLDPRNLLPAWLPLMMVVAAGFAVTRVGLVVVAVLLAVFVGAVVLVDTDRNLQRADYRDAAALIARVLGTQAIIVTPGYNWTPLTYYLPSAPAMRGNTVRVTSVTLLGWRGERLRPSVVRYLADHGFRMSGRRSVQKLRLVFFQAAHSTLFTRHALEGLGLASTRPQVLIRGGL